MMKPEYAVQLQEKALATFLRQDGTPADTAEVIKYEGEKYRLHGQYVIVRKADDLVAVYKFTSRLGPARGERTEGGGVAYVVSSISFGLKRLKRWPDDLVEQGKPVVTA